MLDLEMTTNFSSAHKNEHKCDFNVTFMHDLIRKNHKVTGEQISASCDMTS